jgi:hypothetical protein
MRSFMICALHQILWGGYEVQVDDMRKVRRNHGRDKKCKQNVSSGNLTGRDGGAHGSCKALKCESVGRIGQRPDPSEYCHEPSGSTSDTKFLHQLTDYKLINLVCNFHIRNTG